MKFLVQCTLEVEVELPDDSADPEFTIEDNSCPGTGMVGSAIDSAIEYGQDHGVCWACNLKGRNKILRRIE
jgi:hypothetical protein